MNTRDRGKGATPSRRSKAAAVDAGSFQRLDLGRKNWLLFGAGLVAILIGFLLLSQGDITLAPILLVGGYVVLIPWALVARSRRESTDGAGSQGR
ncbi:MAG: hypothetical protein R3E12_20290 [Candidatus Eisenbacteria bacterium]|uniref:DUF3098 domain-containing protein n=1 Tax=Eiseniibacteriota bacterium TaxID=2212470 RepID=A0A956RMP5_UNCEI|nr:hypothetical protein [Candidatus Eisenbacteria bacterium]